MGQGEGEGKGRGDGEGKARGKDERLGVPALPMPVAVVCCVLNFLVPGLGTFVAGCAVLCCGRTEDMSNAEKFGSCCISVGIAFLQLISTLLFLIGWIWSCVWGVLFVGWSVEYYHNNDPRQTAAPVVTQPGPVYPAPVVVYHHGGQGPAPHEYYGPPPVASVSVIPAGQAPPGPSPYVPPPPPYTASGAYPGGGMTPAYAEAPPQYKV